MCVHLLFPLSQGGRPNSLARHRATQVLLCVAEHGSLSGWGGGQGVSPPRLMLTRYRIWSPPSRFRLRPPAPSAAGHMLPTAVQRVFLFHFSLPASPSHPDPGHCVSLGGRHGPSPGVGAKVGPALPSRQTGDGGGTCVETGEPPAVRALHLSSCQRCFLPPPTPTMPRLIQHCDPQ